MATSETIPLVVPQMGVVEEIIILEWLVDNGTLVAAGRPVVLIETDKAETELKAPISGRIEILVEAGDNEIAVGTELAELLAE